MKQEPEESHIQLFPEDDEEKMALLGRMAQIGMTPSQLCYLFEMTPAQMRRAMSLQPKVHMQYHKARAHGIGQVMEPFFNAAKSGDIQAGKHFLQIRAGWSGGGEDLERELQQAESERLRGTPRGQLMALVKGG